MTEKILERVEALQGVKAVALVSEPEMAVIDNLPQTLEDLVKDGQLVEVEYVLPNMSWRAKSFYLPAGTKVRVINNATEPRGLESKAEQTLEKIKEMFEEAEGDDDAESDAVYHIKQMLGVNCTN
jgi:hypothetical protein